MKKLKKILFILPIILLLTSCYKETYVPAPPATGAYINTYYITATPPNWQLVSTSSQEYWYATFSMPEITQYVITDGVVACYLAGEYDNILPFVASYDDGTTFYTQTIRFDMRQGQITFIIENSDLNVPPPTGNMQFKICIIQNY